MPRIGAGGQIEGGTEGAGEEMAEVGQERGAGPRVGKTAARITAEISGKEVAVFPRRIGEITGGRLTEEETRPPDLTTEADPPLGTGVAETAPRASQ